MKKLWVLLFLYGTICHANPVWNIPRVLIDPQGNVVNYARLYRSSTTGHVVIRYYVDPSVDRLAVEDYQSPHSYAIGPIIRDQLREEAFPRWVIAAQHRFSVEEVGSSEYANLVVYGLRRHTEPHEGPAATYLPGMNNPFGATGSIDTTRLYIDNDPIEREFNAFLDPLYPPHPFTVVTGIENNSPIEYLRYRLFSILQHEKCNGRLPLTHER